MIGEGKYNLNDIKEIKVTESYLGLDMDVRKCQNIQSVNNCTTKHFITNLVEKCGCLPLRKAFN